MSDLRYALRALRRAPGFAVVAILTLALGIGANTAMFSLINAVLLRPMPVDDAGALVSVFTTDARNPGNLPMSHLNFLDVRDDNPAFSGVSAFTFGQVNFQAGSAEPEPIPVQLVSGNYFSVLGVRPVAGRTFLPEEDRTPRSHPVAVLSYGFWQRQFGGSPTIVGRTITLNRTTFTVVGVAPRDFNGVFVFGNPALWAPLMMHDVAATGLRFLRHAARAVPVPVRPSEARRLAATGRRGAEDHRHAGSRPPIPTTIAGAARRRCRCSRRASIPTAKGSSCASHRC